MSIKIERTNNVKFSAKGCLDAIENGFVVTDEKEGTSTLTFDSLKELIGKEVNISISSKELAD
jgi:hypothetical protein